MGIPIVDFSDKSLWSSSWAYVHAAVLVTSLLSDLAIPWKLSVKHFRENCVFNGFLFKTHGLKRQIRYIYDYSWLFRFILYNLYNSHWLLAHEVTSHSASSFIFHLFVRYENDDDMSSDTVGELIDEGNTNWWTGSQYVVSHKVPCVCWILSEFPESGEIHCRWDWSFPILPFEKYHMAAMVFCTEFDIMFGAP